MPIASFPAYRNWKKARSEAVQGIHAMIIGGRLSRSILSSLSPAVRELMLPQIYPGVQKVSAVNVSAAAAETRMAEGEPAVVDMAVSYLISIYHVYLHETIPTLKRWQRDSNPMPKLGYQLGKIHEEQIQKKVNGFLYSPTLLGEFHFVREWRNQVMHGGALQGNLSTIYAIDAAAQADWERRATRCFPFTTPGERLRAGFEEMVAAFHVIDDMAKELGTFVTSIADASMWTDIIVNDYIFESVPEPRRAGLLKKPVSFIWEKVIGYKNIYYKDVHQLSKIQGLAIIRSLKAQAAEATSP